MSDPVVYAAPITDVKMKIRQMAQGVKCIKSTRYNMNG